MIFHKNTILLLINLINLKGYKEKKRRGAISFKQKMLLEYGKDLRRIIEKISSVSSGSQSGKRLKILTPQQMFTRFANTFSTNKSRK